VKIIFVSGRADLYAPFLVVSEFGEWDTASQSNGRLLLGAART
jgi:hypothetical protein